MDTGFTRSSTKNEGLALTPQLSWDTGIIGDDTFDILCSDGLKRKLSDTAIDRQPVNSTAAFDAPTTKRSKSDQKHDGLIVSAERLACPFYKRDCLSAALSRARKGPGWPSIGKLKQVA